MLMIAKRPRYYLRSSSRCEVIQLKSSKTRLDCKFGVSVHRYDTGDVWLENCQNDCLVLVNGSRIGSSWQLTDGDKITLMLPKVGVKDENGNANSSFKEISYRFVSEAHLSTALDTEIDNKDSDDFDNSSFLGERVNTVKASYSKSKCGASKKGRRRARSVGVQVELSNQSGKSAEDECDESSWLHQLRDGMTCVICHDFILNARTLSCSHLFCQPCISQWLCEHNTCPVCRARITTPATPVRLVDQFVELYVTHDLDRQELQRYRARKRSISNNIQRTQRRSRRRSGGTAPRRCRRYGPSLLLSPVVDLAGNTGDNVNASSDSDENGLNSVVIVDI